MGQSSSTRANAHGGLPPVESLRRILEAGIAAPSAENQHLLRFERGADSVSLVSTDVPTWSAQPHRRLLALISYGAIIENMSVRSSACGWAQHTRWWPDPARPESIAEIRWSPSSSPADPLDAAIDLRHTNRRFYRRDAVAREARDRMAAAAQAVDGSHLVWLEEPAVRKLALGMVRLAETERFRREGLHREIFSAIRFDAGWERSVDEGLPPAALEIERPMRALFQALARWPRMHAATRVGLHHSLGMRAGYLPCAKAPHLGLIVCDTPLAEMRPVNAGRALERAWLAATDAGLAFQPMAAAVALCHQHAGGRWVSVDVQARLREAMARLTSGRAETAFMLFRIGRVEEATARTGRPPLERFFTAP